MASESEHGNFEDLKFVDHYESKIESPEKEVISPTKEVIIRPFTETSEGLDGSVENIEDEVVKRMDVENVSHDSNIENDSDSGLDTSNNESESEKFIDRQEDIVYAEKPAVLKPSSNTFDPSRSTSKIVDELFNFINEETGDGDLEEENRQVEEQKLTDDISPDNVEWSLDAMNNNSEQTVEPDAYVGNSGQKTETETEYVLTSKTEPPKIVEDNVHLVPDTPGDANMNLFWYSNNLELDPNEIQEFNNSQETSEESEYKRSSTGEDYYMERLERIEDPKILQEQSLQTHNKNTSLETDSVSSERWSPIFESASSRFIDLASEMKAQPEDDKLIRNKDNSEDEKLEHPWGLEIENKLLLESEHKQEDLPIVEPKVYPVADETNEKTLETSDTKLSFQVRKNINLKQFDSDISSSVPRDTSDMNVQIKSEQAGTELPLDQADAVGYMELADKDMIKEQDTALVSVHENVDSSSGESFKEKDSDKQPVMQNNGSVVKETQQTETLEESVDDIPIDQPDATGYMEIVDKEIIREQVSSSLYSQLSEKDVKNVDNLKRKSEVKLVTEQLEKDNAKEMQTEDKETNVNHITEETVVREERDIAEIESSILKAEMKLESEITTSHEDVVDTATQEKRVELSQKSDSEIQTKENVQAEKNEKVQITMTKHEPIEVKRKFKINEDSESRIASKGGKVLRTETFIDQYFDDSCYKLTLNDSWFRKRNESYELKTSCSAVLSGGRVIADEKMIIQSLQKIMSGRSQISFTKTLTEVASDLGLIEFATFQTTRYIYELGEYTLTLDLTDFGFQSGDVVITVDNPAKVSEAIQKIDRLAQELGFQLLQAH